MVVSEVSSGSRRCSTTSVDSSIMASFMRASLDPKWYPMEPRFAPEAAVMSRAVVCA